MFFRNMSFDVRINNKYFLNWTETNSFYDDKEIAHKEMEWLHAFTYE